MSKFKNLYIFILILAMVIALGACAGSSNVISSAAFDMATIASQDTTALTVQIADSKGGTQVNDTVDIKVMISAPDGQFTVTPVPGSAETLSQPNELAVSLKPGAVLPRDFHFNVTANGAAAGEYKFTVILDKGGSDEMSQEVSLTVE